MIDKPTPELLELRRAGELIECLRADVEAWRILQRATRDELDHQHSGIELGTKEDLIDALLDACAFVVNDAGQIPSAKLAALERWVNAISRARQ